MNTNNVYFARVSMVTNIEAKGTNLINLHKDFTLSLLRYTLVYHTKNNKFYDLLANKYVCADLNYYDTKVGTEKLETKTMIPFNHVINNKEENLSKGKIKKLYMNYMNSSDNNE